MKAKVSILLILILLLSSFSFLFLYNVPVAKAQGESWLTGWDYRKNHTIDMSEVILPLPSWSKYEGNPILNESGNETQVGFNSILKVDSVYHMYYSGRISGTWHVCHATSNNGKDWTKDTENNPLSGLSSAYCPMVWKEGAIWKMLVTQHWGTYGHYCIWYYTSPDGIEWTAQNEGDPVLLGTPEEWDGDTNVEGWGLMKIGNTYHLWYNRLDGPRQSGLATSTNLIDWTKNPNNPIFSDAGFYCQSPFKFGDYYYLLTTNPPGVIALYRDSNPTFYENDRVLLGTAIPKGGGGTWDAAIIDTPFIFCEGIDITRIIPSNTEVWCYYSANDAETITRIGMTIMPSMEESLSSGWMEGYQKRVIVHYGSGSDSGENTYLNGKCRTDFGDIRFTDDDKTTLLDCWMESKVDSDNAVFWLAVEDDLALDDQTVYIYYGKADAVYPYLATELAHGEAVFDAFDDYADESIDGVKWTTTGTPTESGGVMTVGALDGIRGLTTFGLNYGLRFRANMKSPAGATYNDFGLASWDSDFNVAAPYEGFMQRSATVNLWTINTGGYVEDLGTDYQDVQRIWDINRKNVSAVHFWVDGIQLNVGTGHTLASLAPQFYDSGTVEGEGMVVDWVAIRKFVDPEPVHSSWGEEEEPSSNNAPVNDQYSITNMDDTDNLYSQLRTYLIDYDGHDEDNYTEIEHILLNLTQAGTVRVSFKYDNAADVFSIIEGDDKFEIVLGSCSSSRSGTNVNLTIAFQVEGDATEEANLGLTAYITDGTDSDTDTINNYCDVVTRIVTTGLGVNDSRINIGGTVAISGKARYGNDPESNTSSSLYPSDAEFTAIHIYNASEASQGSDAIIVNGVFSVNFAIPNIVQNNSYHVYLDMTDVDWSDGNAPDGDIVGCVGDRIVVYWEQLDDARVNVDANIEGRYKAVLDFDDHTLGSGDSLSSSWGALTWDAGNSWFDISHTRATVTDDTISGWSGSEVTYGITSLAENLTETSYIYDRQEIQTLSGNNTTPDQNEGILIWVTSESEYDNHILGAGDNLVLKDDQANQYIFTFNGTHWTNETSWAVNGTYIINTYQSVNEDTYEITLLSMGGNSLTIKVGDSSSSSSSISDSVQSSANLLTLIFPAIFLITIFAMIKNPNEWRTLFSIVILIGIITFFGWLFLSWGL